MKRPRPKYQVFISSTYRDLKEEREAVTWEVLKARHIPAGMENFTPSTDRGWQTIQRVIDDSDYYILILAGMYGSLDEASGKSWTHLEYEYAISRKKSILAFIRGKSAVTVDKLDQDPQRQEKLAQFIEQLQTQHLIGWWKTKEDLAAAVAAGLRNHIEDDEASENPKPGWYRGDAIPSPAALEEFARLSAENARLQKELEGLQNTPELELADEKGKVSNSTVVHPHLLRYASLDDKKELLAFLDRKNKTHWLSLAVRNLSKVTAREVVVDLTVTGVEAILFYPEEEPTSGLLPLIHRDITPISERVGNPQKHTYVDTDTISGQQGAVRQRVKTVAPGITEALIPIGLRGPANASQLLFEVAYRIGHCDGLPTEGQFSITVTFDENRDMLREEMEVRVRGMQKP